MKEATRAYFNECLIRNECFIRNALKPARYVVLLFVGQMRQFNEYGTMYSNEPDRQTSVMARELGVLVSC
jgi:hypothetical protein